MVTQQLAQHWSSSQELFSPAFQKGAPQIHGQRQQDLQPFGGWLPPPGMARTDQGGQHQVQNDFGSCCAFHQRGPKNLLGRLGEGDLDQNVATNVIYFGVYNIYIYIYIYIYILIYIYIIYIYILIYTHIHTYPSLSLSLRANGEMDG